MDYKFGDKLFYNSPVRKGLRTECIFIRDDNGRAVIMFSNAEWAARANYNLLTPISADKCSLNKVNVVSFSSRAAKTNYVLEKAAEMTDKNISYILISNDNTRRLIIRGLMEKYKNKFNKALIGDNLENCYMVCNPNITPYEIYNLCEQHARNCGVTSLLLDYDINENYTGKIQTVLNEIVSDLQMDVTLMACSEKE